MSANGFTAEYPTVEAYILGITERIWEQRGIGLIRRWYTEDVVMHTPAGRFAGVEAVVSGTVETLHGFPDRRLLGEDIIWSGTGTEGNAYSSHRIISTFHHRADNAFGAATGRAVAVRTVADCLVRDGRICEEWLVRDQSAIALQLGIDPREHGARQAMHMAAAGQSGDPGEAWDDVRAAPPPKDDGSAGAACAAVQLRIWNGTDLAAIAGQFDPAVHLHLPGGALAYGHDGMERFAFGLLGAFPDALMAIEHVITRTDPERPTRVALRWRIAGTHAGHGAYGPASGARVVIPGITHLELTGGRMTRCFVLIDELAIWTAIGLVRG